MTTEPLGLREALRDIYHNARYEQGVDFHEPVSGYKDCERFADDALDFGAAERLAAPPTPAGLDAAWAELKGLLPAKGWWVIAIEHNSDAEPPSYRAVEKSGKPHLYAEWADTPAAALLALVAARLQPPAPAEETP